MSDVDPLVALDALNKARDQMVQQKQKEQEAKEAQKKASRGLFSWFRSSKKPEEAPSVSEPVATPPAAASSQGEQTSSGTPLPRRRLLLVIVIALVVIVLTRIGFGAYLGGLAAADVKEVTALMEIDRAFGWLLAPLLAMFVAIGSMDIERTSARVRFVVVGLVLTVVAIFMPMFLSNYVSTLDTTDLEAARTRNNLGLKVWHWRLIELAVVVISSLVLVMMRKRA